MASVTIPLVGSYNQRGLDGNLALTQSQDQRFLNCTFNVVQNPVTGKSELYLEKRPGWGQNLLVAAGSPSTGLIKPLKMNATISAFGATNSTIYYGTTSVGVITGLAIHFKETIVSTLTHVMIRSSDGTGWYYVDGAKDQTSYTGDTHTNTTIDNIASTAGMYIGQKISGTNIVAGTRIATITSSTAITVDTATTGTTAAVTITKEPIAKIIDTDFTTTGDYISGFEEMDGRLFYAVSTDGTARNSDINSVTSYPASGTLPVNMSPDEPRAVARQKNALMVLGGASIEVYSNAGNAFGSPLQRQQSLFSKIGVLDQRSLTSIEDEIYFVSSVYEGDVGVYRLRGFEPQRISTPSIDKIMGNISATGGTFYASSFRLGGYPYLSIFLSTASETTDALLQLNGDYLLQLNGDNLLLLGNPSTSSAYVRTLVYNIALNIWSEWDSSEATFIDSVSSSSNNQIIATSRVETSGKIYTINPVSDGELYQDDGSAYTMEVRTTKTDFGTEARKFVSKVSLIGSDITSASTATLEYSDDDYATWTSAGSFDLSVINPFITRLGSFQSGRAWRIRHSANYGFRAKALKFDFDIGAH